MARRAILAVIGLCFAGGATLHAETAPQAGFDCAKAKSAIEKAICAAPETAEADRAMTLAYRALLTQSKEPGFVDAFQADQRSFLSIRQQAWDTKPNRQMARERLRDETELRAERLNWINPAPEPGLPGTWANAWGMLTISEATDGSLQVDANVVDQVAGTWLCGYEGPLVDTGPSTASGHTLTETLRISRSGPLLQVENDFCDETGPAINGSMKGLYFRIGAAD